MELNTVNFFSHLIFHPFDAETKTERRIALIASIALGIFSLFTVHFACALYRHFSKRGDESRPVEQEVRQVAEEIPMARPREQILMNPGTLLGQKVLSHFTIAVYQGDLLKQEVDAIVNPAKTSLQGGGGVDGLIGRAAGRAIYQECKNQLQEKGLTRCQTGDAYITGPGMLNERGIKHVIHAVGPSGTTSEGNRLLKDAYTNSLLRAHENQLTSIAFPAISIGIFGFDATLAADLAYEAIRDFDRQHPDTTIRNVRLVFWTGEKDQMSCLRMLELINS